MRRNRLLFLRCASDCRAAADLVDAVQAYAIRSRGLRVDPTSRTQAAPCLFDAAQETQVTFETVFEPILFRLKPMNTPTGFPWRVMTISCDFRLSKKARQSSLISDNGTSFIPDIANRASHETRPLIWPRSPKPRRSCRRSPRRLRLKSRSDTPPCRQPPSGAPWFRGSHLPALSEYPATARRDRRACPARSSRAPSPRP